MKQSRLLPTVLACLLLLCGVPCLAVAAPGDTVVFSYRDYEAAPEKPRFYAEQIVMLDGVFYARGAEQVLRWAPGMTDPEPFCAVPAFPDELWSLEGEPSAEQTEKLHQTISFLAAGDGKLWAFNAYGGRLGELTAQGVQWSDVRVDTKTLQAETGDSKRAAQIRLLSHPFVREGKLYFLRDNYSETEWLDNRTLVCVDTATGALTEQLLQSAQIICPYRPGQLLTYGSMYDEKQEKPVETFTVLDLATGQETKLPLTLPETIWRSLGGLAYDAATDSIYYTAEKQVWCSQKGAPPTVVAYVTLGNVYVERPGWILPDGFYAVDGSGLYLRNIDPQYLPTTPLRLAGGWEDEAYQSFTVANPDVPVLLENRIWGAADIATAIQAGDTQTDIFVAPVDLALRSLLDKGFAADLSASSVISQEIAAMYPQIQAQLLGPQGQPMAYPRSFSLNPWTVDIGLWNRLEMGPLPTTYEEFFGYMLRWQEELAEDNTDIRFLEGSYDNQGLVEVVVRNYIMQYGQEGQSVDFDTPVLRNVLETIRQLDLETPDFGAMTESEQEEYYQMMNRPAVFFMYSRQGMFYDSGRTQYVSTDPETASYQNHEYQHLLPMVFEAGQEPRIRANMYAYFVNPASTNQDLARTYLEYAAQAGIDTYTRYALRPDLNEPVEDKSFQETLQHMQTQREEIKAGLSAEGITPVEKRDQEDYLNYIDRFLAEQDKNRWELAPAAIAGYRQIAPHMVFDDSIFQGFGEDSPAAILAQMIQRYEDNQLSLDGLVKELNNKVNMILLEGR